MKVVCSECHAVVRSEFEEVCHKCGHVFKYIRRHIVARPHHYHIVRDAILLVFIALLVYWAYNIYQTAQEDIIVQQPDVKVQIPQVNIDQPDITVPQQQVTVNVSDPYSKNRKFEKSDTAKKISEYCEKSGGLGC